MAITASGDADALPGAIEHARRYADEVVVGVDEASLDLSLEQATRLADTVFRYAGAPGMRLPMSWPLTRVHAGWLLMLGPTERADPGLIAALPRLLDVGVTHWALPVDSIATLGRADDDRPLSVRLIRTDPSLVWESPVEPGGLRVIGARGDHRAAGIVPALRPALTPGLPGAVAEPATTPAGDDPGTAAHCSGRPHARLVPGIVDVGRLPRLPAWHATLRIHRLAADAPAGNGVLAEIDARNSGLLRWPATPAWATADEGSDHHPRWPELWLVCRETGRTGLPLEETAQRFPIPSDVRPGETVRIRCLVRLPEAVGPKLFHWDLCSAGDTWFAECGAEPITASVRVTATSLGR